MVRPAQTARSERTRDALRQAALVRFLGQGVEETSAEQIAVGRRRVPSHVLPALHVEARPAVRRLRRWPGVVPCRAGRPLRRRVAHRLRARGGDVGARTTSKPCRRSPSCAPGNSTPDASCATSARWKPISPRPSRSTSRGRRPAARGHRRTIAHHRDGPLHRRCGVRCDGGVDARRGSAHCPNSHGCAAPRSSRWQRGSRPTGGEVSSLLTKL